MKILLFANADWYLYNFRLPLARSLQKRGHEVVLLAPPGPYTAQLKQAGFRFIPLPLSRRSLNPLRELATLLRVIRIYRREQPQAAHHFTIKSVLYGSFAAKLAGVGTIVNAITGLGHLFIDQGIVVRWLQAGIKPLYRLALRNTRVVFQNADDQQVFIGHQMVQQERSLVIRGSGVDIFRFSPRPKPAANGPVCVLFAARLLWSKGLGELVEAAKAIPELHGQVLFKIAGERDPGNPATISEADLDRWRAHAPLEFIGHQEDMAALLAEADIVVLPSYREGLPRILLEAAACGLPLVATDTPGCREIVQHGYNGFLVPVKNSAELAQAIYRLATNAYLRRAMGKHSRELACREFAEREVIRKTLQLYQPGGAAVPDDPASPAVLQANQKPS